MVNYSNNLRKIIFQCAGNLISLADRSFIPNGTNVLKHLKTFMIGYLYPGQVFVSTNSLCVKIKLIPLLFSVLRFPRNLPRILQIFHNQNWLKRTRCYRFSCTTKDINLFKILFYILSENLKMYKLQQRKTEKYFDTQTHA